MAQKFVFFPKSYPFGNPVKHLFLSEISVSCKIWGSSFPRGSCASDLNEFFVLRKGGLSTGQKKESKRNGLNLKQIASWKTCSYMFMIFEFDCWLSNISGVDLKNLFIDVPYTVHLGDFFPKGWWVSWLVRVLDISMWFPCPLKERRTPTSYGKMFGSKQSFRLSCDPGIRIDPVVGIRQKSTKNQVFYLKTLEKYLRILGISTYIPKIQCSDYFPGTGMIQFRAGPAGV